MRRAIIGFNCAVAALVVWLHISGMVTGITRAGFAPTERYVAPAWLMNWSGILFVGFGGFSLVFLLWVLRYLFPVAFQHWWVSDQSA